MLPGEGGCCRGVSRGRKYRPRSAFETNVRAWINGKVTRFFRLAAMTVFLPPVAESKRLNRDRV
jgi:hypothetical protein